MQRYSIKIDVAQGNDTDYIVRTTLTKNVLISRKGLDFEPIGEQTSNGHVEWRLVGTLPQVVEVLQTYSPDPVMLHDLLEQVKPILGRR